MILVYCEGKIKFFMLDTVYYFFDQIHPLITMLTEAVRPLPMGLLGDYSTLLST